MTGERRAPGARRLRFARRRLLDLGVAASATAAAAGVAYPAVRFLEPVERQGERSRAVARADEIAPGTGRLVTVGGEPVLILRKENGELRALSARCPHLGCVVGLDGRDIACACHGGRFGLDGQVLAGPPPRPLEAWRAFVLDGAEVVEKA